VSNLSFQKELFGEDSTVALASLDSITRNHLLQSNFTDSLKSARMVYLALNRTLGAKDPQTKEAKEALKMIVQRSVEEARTKLGAK
jgi:hypothetical protein